MQTTIRTKNGTVLTIPYACGGTRASPVTIAPGLVAFEIPGGHVLFNPGNGPYETVPVQSFEFIDLVSDNGVSIAATDPKRGFPDHRFQGGELWPFIAATHIPKPLDAAGRTLVLSLLRSRYRLDLLDQFPGLSHIADLFGDASRPKLCPDGQRDLAWLWRNKAYRLGGSPLKGWYQATCGVGSDGFDNWHYSKLTWMALKFLRHGRNEDWMFGLTSAIAQACWGLYHTGSKWRGYYAYEKSGDNGGADGLGWIGRGQIPDWGKQWFEPTVLWWYLSGKHPLLDMAVQEHLALLARTPANWWGGDWGERRPARYLDSLRVAYLVTGDTIYKSKAQQAVTHIWTQLNAARGLWINKGSPTTTSPWMHGELIGELAGWERLGVAGGDLVQVANRVLAEGTFEVDAGGYAGLPGTLYRFDGPEKGKGAPGLNGFMLPMIRATQPRSVVDRWTEATYGPLLANDWASVEAGTVVDMSNVGIEYASRGPVGWGKECMELMGGMKE